MKYLKRMYQILLELIRPNVWLLDCEDKSTGKHLTIFYVGTYRELDYFIKTICEDICHKKHLGRKFFWHIFYIFKQNKDKCSLAVIEGIFLERYLYSSTKDFFIPFWTYAVADLPLVSTNGSSKKDMQQVRSKKLKYILTKDNELVDDFYYNMHIPMIKTRYEDGLYDFSYDNMIEVIKKDSYKLLLIKKEDEFISGVLLKEDEKVPETWRNGIRDFKYWKVGAISATYIFASEYFYKKGYKKISFGLTRSFLNDGLLNYKRKWNITLNIASKRGFILKPLVASDEVEDFFVNNPFVYMKKNKLYGAVFIKEGEDCSQEDYKKLNKQHYIKGLSKLNIFSVEKKDKLTFFKVQREIE